MSLAEMVVPDAAAGVVATINVRREAWRQALSARRSAQAFRARLGRLMPAVQQEAANEPQLDEAVAVMATLVRTLGWAIHDLDRLRLPDDFFVVVEPSPVVMRPPATKVHPSARR